MEELWDTNMNKQDKINETQERINENVEKHLDIANREMGVIKTDLKWVKKIQWATLTAIGAVILKLFIK